MATPQKFTIITIERFEADGVQWRIGATVRHRKWPKVTGPITSITTAFPGAYSLKVAIAPDDLGAARKHSQSWPVAQRAEDTARGIQSEFIECRDTGLGVKNWELC